MVSGRGSDDARRRANETLQSRRLADGWRVVYLWLPPEVAATVAAEAKQTGSSFAAAAGAALRRGLDMKK